MAVDLISYRKMEDQVAIHEAAAQGVESMENFIQRMSQKPSAETTDAGGMDCSDLTDLTVSRFKKVISLLNRTGHARFRRAPVSSSVPSHKPSVYTNTPAPILPPAPPVMAIPLSVQAPQSVTLDFTKNNIFPSSSKAMDFEYSKDSFSVSASTSSFMSSGITGDASVNGKNRASIYLPPPTASAVKPSVQSGEYQKKRCQEHDSHKASTSKCHCAKKRKNREKRTIRVPAISNKIADIPPDEYSWRKYGQKPIKGSPYPRGYYRCSTMRGCPAKKHVERDTVDPSMLIVTYSGEHRHNAALLLESAPSAVSAMALE